MDLILPEGFSIKSKLFNKRSHFRFKTQRSLMETDIALRNESFCLPLADPPSEAI